MRAEIEAATKALEELLHKYTSLDLVGHLWLKHGIFNPEVYKETDSTVRPHFVEHVTMLQLKDVQYELSSEILVDPADVVSAEELLDKIFQITTIFYASEAADPSRAAPLTALDEFRFATLLREMMVGLPAYPQHWRILLSGLFESPRVAAKLRDTCGFDLKGAITCVEAIQEVMATMLFGRPAVARKQYENMKNQLARYMKTQKFDGENEHKEIFDKLRNMKQKERNRCLKSFAAAWVTVALSDTLSFTRDTLSQKGGLSKETVSSFLDMFSLPFGSTQSDYIWPSPTPSIRLQPIVKMDARYFCPAPGNLTWAIKSQFEEALKNGSDWQAYQKHRADYLVAEGVKALATMLPGCEVNKNVMYVADNKRAELDGLILFDRYAFLIEGKAGTFTPAGRRGAKPSITRSLEDLVADPAQQAIRAANYMRNIDQPVFDRRDGMQITINKRRITDICPITLTLESLDVFTTDLRRLREAGILDQADLPWSVCLTDLWAISELISSPSQFTHFLRWRLAAHTSGNVSVGPDELNWLAIYLREGPEFLRIPVGFDRVTYASYTDDFDAFFHHQGGYRRAAADRPNQPLPVSFRAILASLEDRRSEGFTIATEFLLDLNFSERAELSQQVIRFTAAKKKPEEMLKFETADRAVVVLRGPRSREALIAARHFSTRSRVLVLALEGDPDQCVTAWALDP